MLRVLTLVPATLLFASISVAAPPANLLAGPEIVEEDVTEKDLLNRRLDETGKKQVVNSKQYGRMWLATYRSLELTTEQRVQFVKIVSELTKSQQDFQKQYGKEIKTLRETQRKNKESSGELSSESKMRMLEIHELAPDVEAYQERAWKLLDAEQQVLFQTSLQEAIEEEQKRKEMKSMDSMQVDEMQSRGFSPADSQFRDKDMKDGDTIDRHKDSIDRKTLQRIRFLRKLQNLKEN